MIRVSALAGLGDLSDPSALELLLQYTTDNHSTLVRAGAIRALGEFARNLPLVRSDVWRVFHGLIAVPAQALRFALVAAAERIDDAECLGFLATLSDVEHDGLLRRRARDAARAISRRRAERGDTVDIRGRVDELMERQRRTDTQLLKLLNDTTE